MFHVSGSSPGCNPMLTTHNHQAQRINDQRLKELKNASWFFKAKVTGDFPEGSYPTDFELELKPGARVMFLKNDSSPEKAYFNGKIGVITSIDDDTIYVQSEGEERIIAVHPMEWNNMKVVRGKVEEVYAETIDFLYTAEGKNMLNERNLQNVF